MKQNKIRIIIYNIIFFSTLNVVYSQTYEQTLDFANKQYNEKKFDLALKTYKRLVFFGKNKPLFNIYERIAELSFLENKYDDALHYYDLAYDNTTDKQIKIDIEFKKAYIDIVNKNYQFAMMELASIESDDPLIQKKLNFYLGTTYYGLDNFQKAEEYFDKIVVQDSSKRAIRKLFASRKLHSPSPKTAKILSLIIPGAGQFYTGKIKDGILSFTLIGGMVFLAVYTSVNVDIYMSLISVIPWVQRYYTGGYTKAEAMARLKLTQNRSKIFNKIIQQLDKENTK